MEFSSDPQVLAKTLPWKKPVPAGVKNISFSFDQKEMVLKRGNGNQADKPQNPQLQEVVLDNIYPSACSRHFEEKRNNAMGSVPKIGGSSTGPTQVISCVAKGTSNYLFLNGLYQKEQVTALIDVEKFQVIKKLKTHKLNDMRYIQGYLVGACEDSDGQVGAKAGGIVRVFRVTPDTLEEVFCSKQRYEPKYYESQMANGRILAASTKGHVAFVSADPTQIAVILMGLSKRGFNASEHTLDVKDAVHVAAERDLFIGLTKGGQLQSFTAVSSLRPHRLLNLKGDKGSTEVFTTVASASGYTVVTSIQKTPTKSCFVYLVHSRSMALLDTMPVTPDDQTKGIYPFSGVQIVQNQQAKYIVITEYFERFTLLVVKNNKLQKQISREKLFMERILGSIFVVYKKQTKSIVYGTSKFNSMTL